MNIEHLTKVRDRMAAAPETLVDMHTMGDPGCGTPGCIAGFTMQEAGVSADITCAFNIAEEYLGLNKLQSESLFLDTLCTEEIREAEITKVEVLDAIDSLLDGRTMPVWPRRVQNLLDADRIWGIEE